MAGGRQSSRRISFTKAAIERLETPASGRYLAYDASTKGLAVRVADTGAKTFYLYHWHHGRPVKIKVGGYPTISIEQARNEARRLLSEMELGHDPQAERRQARDELRLKDLWTVYGDWAKVHKRSFHGEELLYDKYLDKWAGRQLSTIGKPEVLALHIRIGKKRPYQANRLLSLAVGLFNFAKANDYFTGDNPAAGVKPFAETARERYLTPDELPRFFAALGTLDKKFGDFFAVLLATGARKSNVLAMAWADIDLAAATWRIPTTKTGKPLLLALSPMATTILCRRRKDAEADADEAIPKCPWVFPGRHPARALAYPYPEWRQLCKEAKLDGLRLHDLRRTLASWAAAGGVSLQIIGKHLGHRQSATTEVYARLNLDPVRAAMNRTTTAMLEAAKVNPLTLLPAPMEMVKQEPSADDTE